MPDAPAVVAEEAGESASRKEDKAARLEGSRDPDSYIEMLERPDRDAYQKPEEVIAALRLSPGDAVADIGAGSGYFTMRFSKAVGPDGRVYAEDVWEAMLGHIRRRAKGKGATNVELVMGAPDDPKLPVASIDLAFICNTWHHVPDRPAFLRNLLASLKPGGRVVIIDYKDEETPVGPPLHMRVPRREVIRTLEEAGLELVSRVEILPYQYFLVFQLKEGSDARPHLSPNNSSGVFLTVMLWQH